MTAVEFGTVALVPLYNNKRHSEMYCVHVLPSVGGNTGAEDAHARHAEENRVLSPTRLDSERARTLIVNRCALFLFYDSISYFCAIINKTILHHL